MPLNGVRWRVCLKLRLPNMIKIYSPDEEKTLHKIAKIVTEARKFQGEEYIKRINEARELAKEILEDTSIPDGRY